MSTEGMAAQGHWRVLGKTWFVQSGQAWLYKVRDARNNSDTDCLAKVLKNVKRIDRFRIEIEVMRSLSKGGKAVVPILDFHLDSTRPFYVMPYYKCGSLDGAIGSGRFKGNL